MKNSTIERDSTNEQVSVVLSLQIWFGNLINSEDSTYLGDEYITIFHFRPQLT